MAEATWSALVGHGGVRRLGRSHDRRVAAETRPPASCGRTLCARSERMIAAHPVWFLLAIACVLWYSTITVYVAVRGAKDIKTMLHDLSEQADEAEKTDPPKAAN